MRSTIPPVPVPDGPPGSNPAAEPGQAGTFAADRKAVMVIYGHDTQARDALFDWLRAIGLRPREWNQLVTGTGTGSPYIGQVLDHAFQQAQAVVALFTPDERVLPAFASPGDAQVSRLQARPNVIFEAGMALVTHPDRTVLVLLGPQELPSDLAGRHHIRLSTTSSEPLHELAGRLRCAGCDTDTTGSDWLRPDRFAGRGHIPAAPLASGSGTTTSPITTSPTTAGSHFPAGAKPGQPITATRPVSLIRTLAGHRDSVFGVAFSPVGSLLATASDDKTARLWDPATGQPGRTLTRHKAAVYGVAFSPDGTLLATTSLDNTARLWDPATGQPGRILTGHEAAVYGVAFSPDGTLLATTSFDYTARLWDLATGRPARILTGHEDQLYGVAFSPDSTLLATASEDGTARLWDLATGRPARILTGHQEPVLGVAFSPDGTLLATTGHDRTARLWDLATGQTVRILTGHEDIVRRVAFSPDGILLATTSHDSTARLWDRATGTCIRTLIGHTSALRGVAFSPGGALLATAGFDKTVRLWS